MNIIYFNKLRIIKSLETANEVFQLSLENNIWTFEKVSLNDELINFGVTFHVIWTIVAEVWVAITSLTIS